MTNEKWNQTKLDDCAEIIMGQSPKGEYYNDKGIGTPLVNGPADYGKKNPDAKQWTTQVTKLCDAGDILFCVRGATVGKMNLADAHYCIGRGVAVIRGKLEISISEYVWYALQFQMNDIVRMSKGSGTTFPNISSNDLKKLRIPLPPLSEQQRIASILSAADKAIEDAGLAVEESERMKKGLMQEIFRQRNAELTSTPVSSWKMRRLCDIFDISVGGDINKEKVTQEKTKNNVYPIYANGIENNGLYGYTDSYKVEGGSITIAGRGVGVGFTIARTEKYYPIVRLIVLKPKINLNIIYYENLLNHTHFPVEKTGVPQLTAPRISNLQIPVPSIDEQNYFANVFSTADEKISLCKKRKALLEKTKLGLMQKLLS